MLGIYPKEERPPPHGHKLIITSESLDDTQVRGDNLVRREEDYFAIEVVDEISLPHFNPTLTNPLSLVLVKLNPNSSEPYYAQVPCIASEDTSSST